MIPELVETAARHEAGHVVMRWLCRWPATEVRVGRDGTGFCAGTGRLVRPEDYLRVALAGPAAEISMLGAAALDWERSRLHDFDDARSILDDELRRETDTETALRAAFDEVCGLLEPHADLVENLADRLSRAEVLSPRAVAALCREHARRRRQVQ